MHATRHPTFATHKNSQVAGLKNVAIHAIAAGESHALAVAADGRRVWGWGCGSSGQLGVGRRRRLRRCSDGKNGGEQSEEVADDREVCSCRWVGQSVVADGGARDQAALCFAFPTPINASPTHNRPLPLDLSALGDDRDAVVVKQVAVGKRHSLLLTRKGRVWSFGSGLYHALGHGRLENVWEPRAVEALEGIGEMRAGVLPSSSHRGLAWIDECLFRKNPWIDCPSLLCLTELYTHTPPRTRADGRFVGGMAAIACGAWHSLALSRTGDVYGWGWARNGLLGRVGEGGSGDGKAAATLLVPAPRLLPLGGSVPDDEQDVEIEEVRPPYTPPPPCNRPTSTVRASRFRWLAGL